MQAPAVAIDRALALFAQPLLDLVFDAARVHREHHNPHHVQTSTLLSVKTGGCPEDCAYCPQAARYATGVNTHKLLDVDTVLQHANEAKAAGATRFCMGAAWRELKDRDLPKITELVQAVAGLGLETCVTLGMLGPGQAEALADAGLDYYNHNIDTAPEFYGDVITTRSFNDRLQTLDRVRSAGLKVCCGGIVGMGETRSQRATLLATLAAMQPPPESVPINHLVPIAGTPLAATAPLDPFEFVRTIAVARLLMPGSMVRLSAGRQSMSDELQALCFMAGANSIFYGDKLLTTANPDSDHDRALLARLGLAAAPAGPAKLPSEAVSCPLSSAA